MSEDSAPDTLALSPIGFIRTGKRLKFETPHQPRDSDEERNVVELLPGRGYEQALRDLAGFDRIWLVWWFHRNTTWRPVVLPPRGSAKKRGVFATRSPHRPNPIGLTAVRLLGIEGRRLTVGNVDLLDGTPILDIKPYIPEIDAFAQSRAGWLEEIETGPPLFRITRTTLAEEQIAWLSHNHGIAFAERADAILSRSPSPHKTRRIVRSGEGFRMGCGAWRIYFEVEHEEVIVQRIAPGYPERALQSPDYTRIPDREAQAAFRARWPSD